MSPAALPSSAEPQSAFEREIARLAVHPAVRSTLAWFRDQEAEFSRWQLDLARIPAPPFGEQARSDWLEEKFHAIGLDKVQKDKIGNVFGSRSARTKPTKKETLVSISAHLDTVFPPGTPLNIRQQGRKLFGPSVSDNAAGVTALLAVAAAFERFELPQAESLLFIGNVGEEGEGDLRGMRHIFSDSPWKDSIRASLVLDGAGSDTLVAEALGSRRFEVVIRGPGGHSWSDFGAPNPIVALARSVHFFSQTPVSTSPKTTFNIGVIRGGTSVNSIPESASMRVDIRSNSAREIERLELDLRRAVERSIIEAAGEEEVEEKFGEKFEGKKTRARETRRSTLTAEITLIGNRPGGELDPNARILHIARAVDAHLGNSALIQRASTDANIPISMGREAIAIGAGGSGGGAHTQQEWFDTTGRELGLARILLIVLALAGDAK
jgi:tripeptide aminopeptidase